VSISSNHFGSEIPSKAASGAVQSTNANLLLTQAFARHPFVGCARPARLHCSNKTKGVANYRIDLLIADIIGLAGALGWRFGGALPRTSQAASHLERTILRAQPE
jgi:hypothetical protein